jgi:NAD+ kinase
MAAKLRILIAGNADKTGVRPAGRELARLINSQPELRCVGTSLSRNRSLKKTPADMILALGGDGTVLSICRRMADSQIPVLGIRFGHKGFLAEVLPEEMSLAVARIAAGRYTISERMRLVAHISAPGTKKSQLVALNEVAVHSGPLSRVVDISVKVNGEQVLAYDGDGIIVSTPTGSTAYSLAAGGPIVDQDMKAMVITPVSPHSLAARPLVVNPNSKVTIGVQCRENKAAITADGQEVRQLHTAETVVVQRHRKPFLLVELGTRGRYQPIRDNLGWMPRAGNSH